MTQRISCYDCRYFSPGDSGRAPYAPNQDRGVYEEGKTGFCHRQAPRHGKTLRQPNGDAVVGFAEWPKVMTHDWCGAFELRKENGNA